MYTIILQPECPCELFGDNEMEERVTCEDDIFRTPFPRITLLPSTPGAAMATAGKENALPVSE